MGLLFIFIYLIIIKLVIEISSSLLQLTGLKPEISRYQAISMLTGTGFTTDESKLIIDHPVRRKISEFLILFGAFSLAVIISSISSILSDDFGISTLSVIGGLLGFLLLILRTPFIKQKLTAKMKQETKSHFALSELPIQDALYYSESDTVKKLIIPRDFKYKNRPLKEMLRHDEDIHVLLIARGERAIRKNLYETVLQEGDQIILYGDKHAIQKRFKELLND